MTGINKSAPERILGRRTAQIAFDSFFDTTGAFATLSALATTDNIITYCPGVALGKQAACMVSKQITYDASRAQDGAFTFAVDNASNGYGLEWGDQFGIITDAGAASSDPIDAGAASTFGWQAYLHVTALTGTNVIVTLEESSDDAVGDAYAAMTGGAFTSATGAGAQRLAGTGNIERYVRVTTSGVFTSATFLVVFVRNSLATSF